MGIDSHAALRKPLLNPKKTRARLTWAREFGSQTSEEWRHWGFSDECSISLFGSGSPKRFWITREDRLKAQYIKGSVQKGGGSIMIWGAISIHGPGPLLIVEGTMNAVSYAKVVRSTIVPYMKRLFDSSGVIHKFVDDNAPIHRAAQIADIFAEAGVHRVWWPASSPDLNPIETLWAIIKNKLARSNSKPTTIASLIETITNIWNNIPASTCMKLIMGMPSRCQEVMMRKGWNTSK
jgi:transposase